MKNFDKRKVEITFINMANISCDCAEAVRKWGEAYQKCAESVRKTDIRRKRQYV